MENECYSVILQVQNEFILATERDSFVEQVREIIEKADEMLSEDASVEPEGDQGLESMRTKEDGFFPGSQVCEGQTDCLSCWCSPVWVEWLCE